MLKPPFSEFALLRLQAGISFEELAARVGFSVSTLYRWERGEAQPRRAAMLVLRQLAGMDVQAQAAGQSFRFIDLFAGIGGLRIGFELIGGRCVFTSEWDRYAEKTYRRNFPETGHHLFAGDIREYTCDLNALSRIPAHDVLLAGFPCQPFSIAGVSKKNALGRPHGFLDDTQGTLFFDVAQILKHHRPKAFLLENVKNLQRHDGGRTFATIMHVLENELGYQIRTRVISARPWVPQGRERIFIVGFREENSFSFDDVQVPEGPWPILGSILERAVDPKYTLSPKLWSYLQAYKEKHTSRGNGFGYGLFGPRDVARTLSARYHKDGSEILIDRGSGKAPRRLTPRECARLMGFERDGREWHIPVSDTQAYRQFGNAVVVPVVEAVAKAMERWIVPAEVIPFPEAKEQVKAAAIG